MEGSLELTSNQGYLEKERYGSPISLLVLLLGGDNGAYTLSMPKGQIDMVSSESTPTNCPGQDFGRGIL